MNKKIITILVCLSLFLVFICWNINKKEEPPLNSHLPTIATSTADIRGYTIEFVRSYFENDDSGQNWSKISILKNKEVLFEAETNQSFSGLYVGEVGDWLTSADDVKNRSIKDITANGIPELILSGYSGGSHCCNHNYIVELSDPLSILLDLDTEDNGIEFKDLNQDGVMEIETNESVFGYWNTSFAASPMPRVVLSLQNGKYKASSLLMRKPTPTELEIQAMAKSVTSWSSSAGPEVAWKYALDLIYSGNIASARKYVDLSWRNGSDSFKTKDDFWKQLKEQITQSPYYNDLNLYFGI